MPASEPSPESARAPSSPWPGDPSRRDRIGRERRFVALQALYDEPLPETELAEAESNLLTFLMVLIDVDTRLREQRRARADAATLRAETDGGITEA